MGGACGNLRPAWQVRAQGEGGGHCQDPPGEQGREAAGLRLQPVPRSHQDTGGAQVFGSNPQPELPRRPRPGGVQGEAAGRQGGWGGHELCVARACACGSVWVLLPGCPEPGWAEDTSINTDSRAQTFVLDT